MTAGEKLTVRRPGADLAGARWGSSGPVVVLLHEGVTDRRTWQGVADVLAGHAVVVAYDRRGFGQTPPSDIGFSHVEDLLAVLREVADGPAWLVGTSAGGGVALDAALTEPSRIAGLVLLAPAVSGAPEPQLDPATARLGELIEGALAAGDLEEVNRLETWLWLDGPAEPEGRVGGPARTLALEMNAICLRNGVPEEAGASGVAAWDRLSEVQAPALVACGDRDLPFLVSRSRDLAARLPRGSYQTLPGVAHLSELEDPSLVTELLLQTLPKA
jgi:pimeloyl-ACP methyl ester carboxylesterase